ncbi:hypothetical protein QUF80_01030, partial [Desulfococcaceae bacterium HSG8]|nr:hypothetical protein [Desulfococcaceae bacterium HSG8]
FSIRSFSCNIVCIADIIKFETNTWSDKRPLTWAGTLVKIDSASDLVFFEYKNGDKIESFRVHVTRIYSLTIDSQDQVNRALPATRQDLSQPLPTNPRQKRILELTNENFVVDDIPKNVRVREGTIITLNGNIVSADIQTVMLKARAANRSQESFEIRRSDLLKWIR